jgi:hypothetical protein
MTPRTALTELLEQHAKLRDLMTVCEELADAVDDGGCEPTKLLREVARLRIAFAAHNEFEEQVLRPVLLDSDSFGPVRIETMIAQHVQEHRSMRARLKPDSPVTGELRIAIADLRSHLEAEERYFLTARVLRDDLVTLESGG